MAKETAKPKVESHVSDYKKKVVGDFVKLIKDYPIIGAINLENMPSPQLANMRRKLRGTAVILMTKRRLLKIAIDSCKQGKKGIEKIGPYLKGMPALIFTKENPFKLYKELEKNKSKAPAKAGQLAPRDLVIPAGATPFAPGPVISELSSIGLKTGVENGKVVIKQDAIVVKEGKEINAKVASMLTRLGIEPMEIGLDLVAIFEDGVIYDKSVLAIDETAFMNNMMNAARWAFNLAVDIGYFTPQTTELLVAKAFREAKAVALEGNIMCDMIAAELVEKAERQMLAIKSEANIPDAPSKPDSIAKKEEKIEKELEEAKEKIEKIGKFEEKEKKVWKEVEKIHKELDKEKKHPDMEDLKEIEEEVEKVEDEIEDVEEEARKKANTKFINAPSKEEILKMRRDAEEKEKQKEAAESKKKEVQQSEKLFEQMKKEGTLRNVRKDPAPRREMTPEEIIRRGVKDMQKK